MTDVHPLTHWPSIAFVRSELYCFLATVLASRQIAEAATGRAAGLEDLLDVSSLEDQAIARHLITAATGLRMLDDRHNRIMKHLDAGVGHLIAGVPPVKGSAQHASVRDACNKVIHAQSVEAQRTPISGVCSYVGPEVTFYGIARERGKVVRWCLHLDAIGFVHEAMLGLAEIEHSERANGKPQ